MSRKLTVDLPDIGEGVVEGEVVEWLKNEGDPLSQDEPVVVVMTDKATVELPSPHPGVMGKHYYKVGEIAKVDGPLYDIIVAEGIELGEAKEEIKEKTFAPEAVKEAPKVCGDKVLATPAVRHLAKQLNLSLENIPASGAQGEVTAQDVKRFLGGKETRELLPFWHFDDDTIEPLVGVRGLMAETMRQSNEMIPHFSFFDNLDVETLTALRKEKGISYMPFYIKALSLSLKEVPYANASLDIENRKIILHKKHNIGLAMNTPQGLVVPVLKNVQELSFEEIVKQFDILKDKALSGSLSPSDMKEGTISLTNFGTLGGVGGTPVIPYPQTAIAGLGKIEKKACVINDKIEIKPQQMVCWSFDHRLIDGALAAKLSSTFIAYLQDPMKLLTL